MFLTLLAVAGLWLAYQLNLNQTEAGSDSWSPATSMPYALAGPSATLLPNGDVLVAGGYDTLGFPSVLAFRYQTATNTWASAGMMATSRTFHTATPLQNGQILVVGGYTRWRQVASAELYDPASNSWSSAGTMQTARHRHTATLLPDGRVVVVGGAGCDPECANPTSVEVFDPATTTWSSAGSMLAGRSDHTATLLQDGKILVAGGCGYEDCGGLPGAEVYDTLTNTSAVAGNMTIPNRSRHTASLLQNGDVLLVGGFDGAPALASTEIYDPIANTWSIGAVMSDERVSHSATLLPNGEVLVAGGNADSALNSSAELFDSVAGDWTTATNMQDARNIHGAVLLPSGGVFVVGGYGATGLNLATAEIYGGPPPPTPAPATPTYTPTPTPTHDPSVPTPTATTPPSVSAFAMSIDCDVQSTGIQSDCATSSGHYAVDIYLENQGAAAVRLGAWGFEVQSDNTVLNPLVPFTCDPSGLDCNPDFDSQSGTGAWACAPPLPNVDRNVAGDDAQLARSWIQCFNGSGDGQIIPGGATMRLGRVTYTATNGEVALRIAEGSVYDDNFGEMLSCDPAISMPGSCQGADVAVTATCTDDLDCDGVPDTDDNCPTMANSDQANVDANMLLYPAPYLPSMMDLTNPDSDVSGNRCDTDDDNDGISDLDEMVGAACSGISTNPLEDDTDQDRVLDGAECALGTDPTDSTSRPGLDACGPTTDSDADRLTDRLEYCFYGTDTTSSDTDSGTDDSGAPDGCEAASFNLDGVVNVADMGMLAAAIANPAKRHLNLDVNKDGAWNPADQGRVASLISPSGQCTS